MEGGLAIVMEMVALHNRVRIGQVYSLLFVGLKTGALVYFTQHGACAAVQYFAQIDNQPDYSIQMQSFDATS